IIQSTMIETGKAVMIAILCSAFNTLSPHENSKINAINACAIPQMTLTTTYGFNASNFGSNPHMNVAESANVIKNVAINSNVTMDNTKPNCTSLNTPNNAVSGGISNILGVFFAVSIPRTPNAANQTKLTSTGANRTPDTNSLIERPLDTRAINIPTNGLQLIHQANWKN